MKRLLSLWLLIFANVCAAQTNQPPDKAQATNQLPDKITIDGVTYENVRWQKPTPSSVDIFHKSGITSIPLWKLPAELQRRFGYDPQKASDWQKAVQKAAAERQRAQEQRMLSKSILSDPLKVGDIGVLAGAPLGYMPPGNPQEISVVQVTGPNEMLANIPIIRDVQGAPQQVFYPAGEVGSGRYIQIPGGTFKAPALLLVWVKGISTAGVVDGQTFQRHDVFRVTGTKSYQTIDGASSTIFVVEPLTSAGPR